MRTHGIVSRPQNISTVAQLSIGGLVSINARTSLPCAAAKRSHSGNRTAIRILTSYAFRQNSYCSITVLRCRPMKLIPACRTPQVSLPNMASLFLSRKTRRQDIISSIFHNLQLYSKVSVAGCFHAWIASADTPLQKTRHVLRKAHFAVRGRHTRPPFLAQPTSYNQPPRAPA